jgi:LuxR family transcriptional regulator, maltose regulon positive regulatory protein
MRRHERLHRLFRRFEHPQRTDSSGHPESTTPGFAETRLRAPRPRQEWVLRRESIHALINAGDARLVLISAPPGSGKSILVAQWRATQAESRAFAWVTLGHDDNDPVSLWTMIVLALTRALPEIDGARILRTLTVPKPDIENVLLPQLLGHLSEQATRAVLVLDDLHVITEPACYRQIELFLDNLPPTVQLVLLTRTDPLLPIARYRAAGSIVEMRMPDLRFTRKELDKLIRRVSAFRLTDTELDGLYAHAEGWPAGAYLAALSLRDAPDPAGFIGEFAGSNRYVVDYLWEEVVTPLPADVRRFLLRTSILERFTATLCEAVAEVTHAEAVIERLERSNLFLVCLDSNRRWYRYHHLFREVLHDQLLRMEDEQVSALHRRAGEWLADHGHVDEAIEHLLVAGDVDRAGKLVASHWISYVNAGRLATVNAWLELIGTAQISAHPAIAITAAWLAVATGDRDSARHWLAAAESVGHNAPLPDGARSLESAAAMLRCVYGIGGIKDLVAAAETAATIEIDPNSPWYMVARATLGQSRYLSGDLESAVAPLEEAARAEMTLPIIRILALSVLSLIDGEFGRTTQATVHAEEARRLVDEHGFSDAPPVSLAYTAHGAALTRIGQYTSAWAELEHAALIQNQGHDLSPWPQLANIAALAQLSLNLGDLRAARFLVDDARNTLNASPGEAGHIGVLLERIEQRFVGQPAQLASVVLTEREKAVLGMLRGDLSQQEIARELYVSINTVKTHTSAIYRKLGVSSRSQAIDRARQLGLI